MAFRAMCVILLLSSLPVAGCGTVANVARSRPEEGGRIPFGGVKQDVACIRNAATGELSLRKHPKAESEQYPQVLLILVCAADLPFSLIGDVVTWPYTAAYTFINRPVPTPPVIQELPPSPLIQPVPLPAAPVTPATAASHDERPKAQKGTMTARPERNALPPSQVEAWESGY